MATPTFFLPHEALANEPTLLDRIASDTAKRAAISKVTREEDAAQRTQSAWNYLNGVEDQPQTGMGALFGQRSSSPQWRREEDAVAFLRAQDPERFAKTAEELGTFMANVALPRIGSITDPRERLSVLQELSSMGPPMLRSFVSKVAADGVITDDEVAQANTMFSAYKKAPPKIDYMNLGAQGVWNPETQSIMPNTARSEPPPKVPAAIAPYIYAAEHPDDPGAQQFLADREAARNQREAAADASRRRGLAGTGGGRSSAADGPGGQSAKDKIWAAQHANDSGPIGVAARAMLGSHAPPAMGDVSANGSAPTGNAFLATLPKNTAALVRGLAEGRQAFPTGAALRSEYWQQMLNMVAQYDPQFDAANAQSRYMTRRDFTSGLMSRNVTALNTVMGHLDSLEKAVDALDNSDYPAYNAVANWAVTATGDPRVRRLNLAKTAVADELERVFRGTGGTLEGTKNWQAQFDAASSPEQLRVAVATAVELVRSRLEAVGDAYARGMRLTKDPIDFLNPRARAAYERLTRQYETGLQAQQPGAAVPAGGHPQDIQDILRRHSGQRPGG